ncbi:hypothetical protein [Sedimenticola selenatireducens]|uniref:hypothetical protein n=1 Tax=Sedimenticola selenatireducens TaxID=191960 RepID=UPI002AAC0D31|nr:hypothetical protein [Sedimenticola selenatireducens]
MKKLFVLTAVASTFMISSCATIESQSSEPVATKTKDGRDYYVVYCADALQCALAADAFCPPKVPLKFLDPYDTESSTPGFYRDGTGRPYVRMVCKI